METTAGQSHGDTFVEIPARNARLGTQDSSNRSLKRRFDTTSGRRVKTVHHHEPQNRRGSQSQPSLSNITLPERSGDLTTEADLTDPSYDVTYCGPVPRRNNEDASRTSGAAPQTSPPSTERDVHIGPVEEAYSLPSQTDETWTAQDISSFGDITSMDMAMLPDHVLSPSISSSYNLEDGIFEPGSAYQNLFQSLRSHVFRTAQIENNVSENSHASGHMRSPLTAGRSDAFVARSTGTTGSTARNGNTLHAQKFELPLAQEYLLWKAWTEEVSIWVWKAFLSFAITETDENLA